MIFVIDVGNTNMTMGVISGEKDGSHLPDHDEDPQNLR